MNARRLACAILLGIGLGFDVSADARGDIVLVAGRHAVISDIGRDEAEQLFLGRLNALRDGTPVRLHDLPPGPIRDTFYRNMIGKNAVQTRAYWSRLVFTGRARPPREVTGPEELRVALTSDPNAIGYLSETDVTDELLILLRID